VALAGGNRVTVYLSQVWAHLKGAFPFFYANSASFSGILGPLMRNSKDLLKIA
jgi:hypothetical protein